MQFHLCTLLEKQEKKLALKNNLLNCKLHQKLKSDFSKLNCPDKIIKKFPWTRIIVGDKVSFACRLRDFFTENNAE